VIDCARGEAPPELELCPELMRTLQRELAEMDARIGAMQRTRGNLASYLA
jgi:hypothetical protein